MKKKGWSREIKELLLNWKQQININENEHLYRAVRFKYLNNFLTVFDLVSNGTIFTILLYGVSDGILEDVLLKLSAIIDALVIINILITANFDFGVLSQKHFEAGRDYNALSKLIVSTLTLKVSERGNEKDFVDFVRKRFEKIVENSIGLPYNKKIHQLEMQIFEDPEDARGHKESIESDNKNSIENSSKNDIKFEQRLQTEQPEDYMTYQWKRFQLDEES